MDTVIWTVVVGMGGAAFSWALAHFYYRLQARTKGKASSRLDTEIRQSIAGSRGRQIGIVHVDNPTIVVNQYARDATWIKKGDELGALFPGTRNREISSVEFVALRYSAEQEFADYKWLDESFSRALRLVLSASGAGTVVPFATLPEPVRPWAEVLTQMEEDDRLSHLVVPEMRRINGVEAGDQQRWEALETYASSLSRFGNNKGLFFVGQGTTVQMLNGRLVAAGLSFAVVESRGRFTADAAALVQAFLRNHSDWAIKRVDMAQHDFEDTGLFRIKMWIELVRVPAEQALRTMQQRDQFVQTLESSAREQVVEHYTDVRDRDYRLKAYTFLHHSLKDVGGALLSGSGEGFTGAINLASSFAFLNPALDYMCHLYARPGQTVPNVGIFFSLTSFADRYKQFLAAQMARAT